MESSYSVTFTATGATRVFEKQEGVEDTGEMAKAKLQLSYKTNGGNITRVPRGKPVWLSISEELKALLEDTKVPFRMRYSLF